VITIRFSNADECMNFLFGTKGKVPKVRATVELGDGDVFVMGGFDDGRLKHSTEPHGTAGAFCITITCRYLSLFTPFQGEEGGIPTPLLSKEAVARFEASAEYREWDEQMEDEAREVAAKKQEERAAEEVRMEQKREKARRTATGKRFTRSGLDN